MGGVEICSVDSLQVCALQVFFLNTFLEEDGVYITIETHKHSITKSLKSIGNYMDLAFELLCFRDQCITTSNAYDSHLINEQDNKRTRKRSADHVQDSKLTIKQESIRGTWNPPRSSKSRIPEAPKNLLK
jgi:hypothetical protein